MCAHVASKTQSRAPPPCALATRALSIAVYGLSTPLEVLTPPIPLNLDLFFDPRLDPRLDLRLDLRLDVTERLGERRGHVGSAILAHALGATLKVSCRELVSPMEQRLPHDGTDASVIIRLAADETFGHKVGLPTALVTSDAVPPANLANANNVECDT